MLPCNIIVQELEKGKNEIAAVKPRASMQAVGNKDLEEALEIGNKLQKVIDRA